MNDPLHPDWDPHSEAVVRDQVAAYDELRERCPVAYSERFGWSVFRHEDVRRILQDHESFSNAVSQHLSVPNGMDPPEHTAYRQIIEPYFSPARMEAFEPVCRAFARRLVQQAIAKGKIQVMDELASQFAVAAQCAFLGWPESLHERLIQWTQRNQDASRQQAPHALSELAREFEAVVDDLLERRIRDGAHPDDDVTAALLHETVNGRRLSNEEISSVLRNWTVGEVGTISASVGILLFHLTEDQSLQTQLRESPELLPPAIDEILRVHGPLVANRRVTTCPVEIGGRQLGKGERVSINWIAANRDGRVFDDPATVRLDRDPQDNLLYGAGIHVCPGAPLARLEMRVMLEELLQHTTRIERSAGSPTPRAVYPASGYSALMIELS